MISTRTATNNRGFPDILDGVVTHVDGRLGNDRDANVSMVRAAAAAVLDRRRDLREDDVLKVTLFRLSCDCDFVLDLHTAWEALPHMLVTAGNWPDASDLACEMASEVVIVDRGNPLMTFKSAHVLVWQGIAERFPGMPLAPGCLPVVLELRGQRDVDDHFTELPRRASFAGCREGRDRRFARGPSGSRAARRVSVSGLKRLLAARGGIVIYLKHLARMSGPVRRFAEILDPESGGREPVTSPVHGLLHARRSHRLVRKGQYFLRHRRRPCPMHLQRVEPNSGCSPNRGAGPRAHPIRTRQWPQGKRRGGEGG